MVHPMMSHHLLANHQIWSTIKTLPATLPEPSFKDGISSAGVTEAVSQSDLDIGQGVGADTRVRLLRAGPWLMDWQLLLFSCFAPKQL